MSKHEAVPEDVDRARQSIEALAAENDIENLQEYLAETGSHIAASTYVGLVRSNLELQRQIDQSEGDGKRHRIRKAAGALGLVTAGFVSAFAYAHESVDSHMDTILAGRDALTEKIPPEAAVYIPGAVARSLIEHPELKELPVVPTAAWCEPNPVIGQPGTLHYDVVINPRAGAGIPDPTLNSEYCEPSSAITQPTGFAEKFDLAPYTFGK